MVKTGQPRRDARVHERVLASAVCRIDDARMAQPATARAIPRSGSQSPAPAPRDVAEELKQLRRDLKLNRATFGRVLGCSERGLANWEAGRPIQAVYLHRIAELRNLFNELANVIEPSAIGEWLLAPNEQFDGLKPVEVIERGESFRVWKTIVQPRSKA